jgi:hypothetical protein
MLSTLIYLHIYMCVLYFINVYCRVMRMFPLIKVLFRVSSYVIYFGTKSNSLIFSSHQKKDLSHPHPLWISDANFRTDSSNTAINLKINSIRSDRTSAENGTILHTNIFQIVSFLHIFLTIPASSFWTVGLLDIERVTQLSNKNCWNIIR